MRTSARGAPPHRWIEENLAADDRLGYDPWLHTWKPRSGWTKLCGRRREADRDRARLDRPHLGDRPAPPLGAVTMHDVRFAGEDAAKSLPAFAPTDEAARRRGRSCRTRTPSRGRSHRGADVAHTPLPLAFATFRQAAGLRSLSRPQARPDVRPPRGARRGARSSESRRCRDVGRRKSDRAARSSHRPTRWRASSPPPAQVNARPCPIG